MQDSPVEQTFRDTERKLREKIKRYEEVMEKAQVVYEHDDGFDMHVGPFGYSKVGVLIEDRVIWLACHHDTSTFENYLKWEGVAKKIVGSLNSD